MILDAEHLLSFFSPSKVQKTHKVADTVHVTCDLSVGEYDR